MQSRVTLGSGLAEVSEAAGAGEAQRSRMAPARRGMRVIVESLAAPERRDSSPRWSPRALASFNRRVRSIFRKSAHRFSEENATKHEWRRYRTRRLRTGFGTSFTRWPYQPGQFGFCVQKPRFPATTSSRHSSKVRIRQL